MHSTVIDYVCVSRILAIWTKATIAFFSAAHVCVRVEIWLPKVCAWHCVRSSAMPSDTYEFLCTARVHCTNHQQKPDGKIPLTPKSHITQSHQAVNTTSLFIIRSFPISSFLLWCAAVGTMFWDLYELKSTNIRQSWFLWNDLQNNFFVQSQMFFHPKKSLSAICTSTRLHASQGRWNRKFSYRWLKKKLSLPCHNYGCIHCSICLAFWNVKL